MGVGRVSWAVVSERCHTSTSTETVKLLFTLLLVTQAVGFPTPLMAEHPRTLSKWRGVPSGVTELNARSYGPRGFILDPSPYSPCPKSLLGPTPPMPASGAARTLYEEGGQPCWTPAGSSMVCPHLGTLHPQRAAGLSASLPLGLCSHFTFSQVPTHPDQSLFCFLL